MIQSCRWAVFWKSILLQLLFTDQNLDESMIDENRDDMLTDDDGDDDDDDEDDDDGGGDGGGDGNDDLSCHSFLFFLQRIMM